MDYNQYIPFLLLIVIIVLYNLYRIKKKKLIEEEQKYIGTFLLRDQDISLIRTGSPFKTSNVSLNKNILGNETEVYSKSFESPISNRNQTKTFRKGSPSAKSPIVQGKLSPTGFAETFQEKIYSLSPKDILIKRESIKDHSFKNLSFETIKLNKVSEFKALKGVDQNDQSDSKKKNFQKNLNLRFQELENNQTLGSQGKNDCLKIAGSTQYAAPSQISSQIEYLKDERTKKLERDNFQESEKAVHKTDGQNVSKRQFNDNFPHKEKKKNSQIGIESFIRKEKNQLIQHKDQFETKNDSSFEIEYDIEGKDQKEEIKKLPATKIKFEIDYLTESNSGLKLKKYVAKKIVQEYTRETHSIPKSMNQLRLQTLEQKSSVGQPPGISHQSVQTSNHQGSGSLLQNSSSLNQTNNDTNKAKHLSSNLAANPENKQQSSLLGSQPKPETQVINQPKQSSLLGNTGENKAQLTPQNQGSTLQNTITQGQNKETEIKQPTIFSSNDKPKPQIQTSGLFKTNVEDKKHDSILGKNSGSNTSTPMFAKGSLDSSTGGKSRSNAIDFSDKEDALQKKIK